MLNAALRINIPTVFVSGGPMEAGKAVVVEGVARTPTDLITAISASATDSVDEAGLREVERSACPTCGSCSGMFTANSMNCLTETLGLSLPGNELVERGGERLIQVWCKSLPPRKYQVIAMVDYGGKTMTGGEVAFETH